jgi:hypothetical protein
MTIPVKQKKDSVDALNAQITSVKPPQIRANSVKPPQAQDLSVKPPQEQ